MMEYLPYLILAIITVMLMYVVSDFNFSKKTH